MAKFVPCRICARKEGPQAGYYYVEKEGKTFIKECSCHKRWEESQLLARRLKEANLWDSDYKIDNYVGEISKDDAYALVQYIESFKEKFHNKMLYMYGHNSTQKTTLAQWVGKSLVEKGFTVYYTLMESLSVALIPNFNDDSEA